MLISSINHGVPNPVGMTEDFQSFWNKLPSYQFKTVAQRVRRLAFGHKGDAHQCYTGNARVSIYELRIRSRPGLRAYFSTVGGRPLILCGGTKSTQRRDLQKAIGLLQAHRE